MKGVFSVLTRLVVEEAHNVWHEVIDSQRLLSKFSQSSKSSSAFCSSTSSSSHPPPPSKLTATFRHGFSSCLLLLQLDCRLPVF